MNRSISDFRGVFYFFHRDILSRKVVSDKPGTVQEEMRNTTKLQEEQLKEMRVQYESALVNERLKIQPFFDLQLLRYSEVSESDQFSLTLNFKLDCIEGYARSIRLIYNQGESSSFEIINLIRTGINNRLLLAVQIAKTHEMHDKFFDLEYYDLKNNMTTQRYVFMYRGDEKPEMIFEKFIFN
ncbi:hypothetical protein [Acinetobacter colistiniresistens]|uniref:hypothetical protein n=1 Tax=Acinetobacter colistiniresistens TaxID=280145 RepID=UPI00148F38F4|nr:hypothetical protein [Acinetobacter colistiniresistens]